ncbi:FxsA family protein [Pseudomonas zhanjiangensis]|uniref:FxsA family protein n=1 Tax=Pseudomonas zhanjiangensis TaxID=3239015 RepID=A0ABV3YSK8_9PSED
MRVFLLLFLLFPIVELALLIKVGSAIGVLPTLLLVIGSAILGSVLLRVAGLATAWRAREKLARGELPEQEMLEGLTIALGGGLLLLPGFISDIFGVFCLIPFTRRLLVNKLRQRAAEQAMRQRAFADELARQTRPGSARPDAARPDAPRPNVIEGEYERRD